MAPLAWVPWVPGNPSVFEQWVPEPISFETKKPKFTYFFSFPNEVFLGYETPQHILCLLYLTYSQHHRNSSFSKRFCEEARKMSLVEVANEFAAMNDRRRADFGHNKFM